MPIPFVLCCRYTSIMKHMKLALCDWTSLNRLYRPRGRIPG